MLPLREIEPDLADWLTLLIQIPLGVLIYVLGSKILKLDSFDYILTVAKRLISGKKAGEA